jgi:hypothetical protein
MSALSDVKRTLRQRSEYHLRVAVLRDLGRGQPSTTEPYRSRGGWAWRLLFVPLYRRIPWSTKERAMQLLGMTARGWQPPARRPGEPWRPPVGTGAGDRPPG